MKLSWTSPDQIPGIQRWGVLPLYFAAAGALGGPIGCVVAGSMVGVGSGLSTMESWAILEASVGLGVGYAALVSRRAWIGVLVSPLMALSAVFCAVAIRNALQGEYERSLWKEVLKSLVDPFVLVFMGAQPPILTLAHSCALRFGRGRFIPMAVIYGIAGVLWGGLGQVVLESKEGLIQQAVLQGAFIGLFQFTGMAAAQAFSGVGRLEEGGAA